MDNDGTNGFLYDENMPAVDSMNFFVVDFVNEDETKNAQELAFFWAAITQARAAERQASALEAQTEVMIETRWRLERIADSVNSIDIAAQRSEERMAEIEVQLGRIAAVLEAVKGKAWIEEGFVDCLFISPQRV